MAPRLWGLLIGRDKGTVAVTFLLSLPVLLTVIGIFVQFALLANARLAVQRAVDAAGRSAMVCVGANPVTEQVDAEANALKSACMVLATLSPASPASSANGVEVAEALRTLGVPISPGYENRYAFAEQTTKVSFSVAQDPRNRGTECMVTVTYPFRLNVPIVGSLVGTQAQQGGVDGRYYLFTVSRLVQLSPGREAYSSGSGAP